MVLRSEFWGGRGGCLILSYVSLFSSVYISSVYILSNEQMNIFYLQFISSIQIFFLFDTLYIHHPHSSEKPSIASENPSVFTTRLNIVDSVLSLLSIN